MRAVCWLLIFLSISALVIAESNDDLDRAILADHKLGQTALVNDLASLGSDPPEGLTVSEAFRALLGDWVFRWVHSV